MLTITLTHSHYEHTALQPGQTWRYLFLSTWCSARHVRRKYLCTVVSPWRKWKWALRKLSPVARILSVAARTSLAGIGRLCTQKYWWQSWMSRGVAREGMMGCQNSPSAEVQCSFFTGRLCRLVTFVLLTVCWTASVHYCNDVNLW